MNYGWNKTTKQLELSETPFPDATNADAVSVSITPVEIKATLCDAFLRGAKVFLIQQHRAVFGSQLREAKDAIEHVLPISMNVTRNEENFKPVLELFSIKIPELLTAEDSTMEHKIIGGVTTAVANWRQMGFKSPVHAAASVVKNYAVKHGFVHGEVWSE